LPPLYIEIFIFVKYKNLNFWWNFKVSFLGRFWQILGSFGQFWAEFAALTVAESMPEERLNN
jgi:hypothetical protein